MNSTTAATTTTRWATIAVAALLSVVAAVVGLAAPASAGVVQTYASTPVNGMWHRGTVQFYNGNQNIATTITFNDRAGDAYCTQLRMKAFASNGAVDLFITGTVCGGRSATLSNTTYAPIGYRIDKLQIWTVRVDGGARSYVWDFWP